MNTGEKQVEKYNERRGWRNRKIERCEEKEKNRERKIKHKGKKSKKFKSQRSKQQGKGNR